MRTIARFITHLLKTVFAFCTARNASKSEVEPSPVDTPDQPGGAQDGGGVQNVLY